MKTKFNRGFSRWFYGLVAIGTMLTFTQAAVAQGAGPEDEPWEKFGIKFGVFLSAIDSSIRFGTGVGLDIDVEEILDMESSQTVFRTEAVWRFSDNRRHRLDFTWLAFNRDAQKQIFQDITIEDDNGNPVTIAAGSTVESNFDLDIYQLAYSYSFFQDDRIDLAVGLGVYVMPIEFSLASTGGIMAGGSEDFTAPLPVLGLRMDVALTPKWFIRSKSQVFYLEYENFTGTLLGLQAALEYNPWKHVGIGLGFDALGIRLEAEDEDWPGADFRGNVEFSYTGLQLYLHLFF